MKIEKTIATLITGIFIGAVIAGKRVTWLRYDTGGNVVVKQEGQEDSTGSKTSYPRVIEKSLSEYHSDSA